MCHQCNVGVSQVRSVRQGDFAGLWFVLGICSPVITDSLAESFLALQKVFCVKMILTWVFLSLFPISLSLHLFNKFSIR